MTPVPGRPIGDYALLSDCHSSALVSGSGSIDWACLRRFDSPSVFARLLDEQRGGSFSIAPVGTVTSTRRRYVPGTMVLETTFVTDSGQMVLTDAFAMRSGGASDPRHQLLRRAAVVSGQVEIEVIVEPRFDYGNSHPWLRNHGPTVFSAVAGDEAFVLTTEVPLDIDHEAGNLVGRTVLSAGESGSVTLISRPAHLLDISLVEHPQVDGLIDETTSWWTDWSHRTLADGPNADLIERSALVLKSLCCAPTGAIVAAVTTSLPEIPGGPSNWDYRYCWVRDTTMTLEVLADVGHGEVAQGFRDFILRSAAGRADELQIMYGSYGERRLPEFELDLAGWRGARPVRIGNGAATQTQLDVYGHLLDAAHIWHDRHQDLDQDEWRFLRSLVDRATALRHTRDSGIWELRGRPRHYVHSKAMIWVALDRGIRLVDEFGLDPHDSDVDAWREARDDIRFDIDRNGVDHQHGHFVQHYESAEVDASLLKLPLVGFVEATDPRMIATVAKISRDLGVGPDGFLRRFRRSGGDGPVPRPEGVFLLCTLWLVEVLAMQGRQDEAEALFDSVSRLANDVGLFAEEYDTAGREFLGNFPQAFTHLGLISAARRLRPVADARPVRRP